MADSEPPPPKILVRGKEGLSLFAYPSENETLSRLQCSSAYFSPDGTFLSLVTQEEISVFDSNSGKEILKIPSKNMVALCFSPKNNYLQIFQKPNGQEKNLVLRKIEGGGEIVFQQFQKTFSKSTWPSVQFSEDESVACRCMTNEVHFYDPQDFSKGIIERLKVPGISGAQMAVDPPSHTAIHVGEAKGGPASVRIFKRPYSPESLPVARRSFYKATTVKMVWNTGSTGVLALAHSDVDKTNQSYYGESTLHFLTCDGMFEGAVPLGKEGPIHDMQWSPSGKEFLVVHGFMPSKATLFDAKCRPLFDFGSGPRNIVRWSPHGRYICLAGFGNLPGDVEFWERVDGKCAIVGKTRAAMGVSVEWSPSSHEVLVATTAPRLQVDNGIRVFTLDGTMVYQKSYSTLFQADWRPSPSHLYPDKPFTPPKTPAPSTSKDTNQSSQHANATGSKTVGVKAPPPAPAYRPPGARGGDVTSAFRAQLSGEKDKPRVIGEAARESAGESKSAAKNKKRREKEKEKKKEENTLSSETAKDTEEVTKGVEAMQTPSTAAQEEGGGDVAKKLRALAKKLRQIEELKKKESEGGSLTAEQREKVKQEGEVKREIEALEAKS